MLSNELHLVVLEHCLKGVAHTQANWWVQKPSSSSGTSVQVTGQHW